jgi:anti-anti-sigma regulatory factor
MQPAIHAIHIVVDMSEVRGLDESALPVLIDAHRRMVSHTGHLEIRPPSPWVMGAEGLGHLSSVLHVI